MRTFNTLIHRIVIPENSDLLSLYLIKDLEKEVKIQKNTIEMKSCILGIEPHISQLMKTGVLGNRDKRTFQINKFQMSFDAKRENGEKIEGFKLVWSGDMCKTEDWESFKEIFEKNEQN